MMRSFPTVMLKKTSVLTLALKSQSLFLLLALTNLPSCTVAIIYKLKNFPLVRAVMIFIPQGTQR